MRWIVYLLALCLILGGAGALGLSVDLQGIERGTTLAISGTVALVGGVLTLAIGIVIGRVEALTAALAPEPAIPPLNLPAPLHHDRHEDREERVAHPAPPVEAPQGPGPSAGSVGGAAGAAALAASAYAYRELRQPAEAETPAPAPAAAPIPAAPLAPAPGFAVEPFAQEPAPSLKPLELEEDRAAAASEDGLAEEPAVDREALIEAAIRHEIAFDHEEPLHEPAEQPQDPAAHHDELAAEAPPDAEPFEAEAAADETSGSEVRPVEPDRTNEQPEGHEEPSPVAEAGEMEPDTRDGPAPVSNVPVEAAEAEPLRAEAEEADAAPEAAAERQDEGAAEPAEQASAPDPLAWLDRTDTAETTPPAAAAEPKPAPSVVGRYQSGGVQYTMYSDGSIEAETQTETLRFGSMRELKAFIESRAREG